MPPTDENLNSIGRPAEVQRLPSGARHAIPAGVQRVAIRHRSKPVKDPEEEARKKAEREKKKQDQAKSKTPAEIAAAARQSEKAEMNTAIKETIDQVTGLAGALHERFPHRTAKWFHDTITHKSKFTNSRSISRWNVHSARMLEEENNGESSVSKIPSPSD